MPETPQEHPKSIRRRILLALYARYREDPLALLAPRDFESHDLGEEALGANIHYLSDRRYVEIMTDYYPPHFVSARITPDGIDLVENSYEFDLRFPPALDALESSMAGLPHLVERLLAEAELSALDGEARRALLRDVQYLRNELARPAARVRAATVDAVLGWIAAPFEDVEESLPSLEGIRTLLARSQNANRT